jgi:hypothetical protein
VLEYNSSFTDHIQAMAVAGAVSCILVSSLLLAVGLPALFNWGRKSPDASVTFARKQVA